MLLIFEKNLKYLLHLYKAQTTIMYYPQTAYLYYHMFVMGLVKIRYIYTHTHNNYITKKHWTLLNFYSIIFFK